MTLRAVTWGLLAATLTLYLVIVLWSLAIIQKDAGGLVPFDMRPMGYSEKEAWAFLAALGPKGLAQYLGPQKLLDLIYPALMGVTLALILWQLLPRRWALGFIAVVVIGAVCDYVENAAVAGLLAAGADRIDEVAVSTASRFSVLKALATTVAMAAALVAACLWLWRKYRGTGA